MTGNAPMFRNNRRVLIASMAGTAIEYYDFYIYATAAALVFGPLFFPAQSIAAQQISAYASLAVAFIARPVGAVAFGHFGDRVGRKSTLIASLLIMGISTVLIALLPTYASAGWVAPLLLCVLRFGQGFGLGGEWGGAALLATENAPSHATGRFGMFPQFGAPAGFILANGAFLLLGASLTADQFEAWGWRIPFLGAVLLVGLGLWIRLRLTETPVFARAIASAPPPTIPLTELIRNFPRELFGATFAVTACFALFYLSTAFAMGYATTTLGYERVAILSALLCAALFMGLGIAAGGHYSDVVGARRVLMAGCILTVPVGLLFPTMLNSGSLLIIGLFLSLAMFVTGVLYGPLGGWLPSLFSTRVRYTGASLSFNAGGILGGALTPLLAEVLSARFGLIAVGMCLAGTAALSFAAIALPRYNDLAGDAASAAEQG